MKKLLFILLSTICLYSNTVSAQGYGLSFGTMNPLGETAYLLKPGVGGEFHFLSSAIDDRWQVSFDLSYYVFKPTQDTFNAYGIEYNQQTLLYPNYTIIKKYSIASIGGGFTFKILNKKLSPIVGADAAASVISISQIQDSKFVHSESGNDTYWRIATGPKVGVSYEASDHWLINAGVGTSLGLGNTGLQNYWKPFIGINYFID